MKASPNQQISTMDLKLNSKLRNFETKLLTLDAVPGLVNRVDEAEKDISAVIQKLVETRKDLQSARASGAVDNVSPTTNFRIEQLKKRNAVQANIIFNLGNNGNHLLQHAQIIISGLSIQRSADFELHPAINIKNLTTATLKSVYPDLEKIKTSENRDETMTNTYASKDNANASDIAAASFPSSRASSNLAPTIVSLSSREMLSEILRSKYHTVKLHTCTETVLTRRSKFR